MLTSDGQTDITIPVKINHTFEIINLFDTASWVCETMKDMNNGRSNIKITGILQ